MRQVGQMIQAIDEENIQ